MKPAIEGIKKVAVRAILLDVDGVLAPPGSPIPEKTRQLLHILQTLNIKIVLISGKPVAYLQGLVRGMGLNETETIIVGENGAVVFDPSQRLEILASCSFKKEAIEELRTLKEALADALGKKIWFQQNQVIVTVFPRGGASVEDIMQAAKAILSRFQFKAIEMIQHVDAVDLIPAGLNKGEAVEIIANILGISPTEMAAVGDSYSDVLMLKSVAVSFAPKDGDTEAKKAANHIIDELGDILQIIASGYEKAAYRVRG